MVNTSNIPDELKQMKQWLNWRKVVKPDLTKPMKFPLAPANPTVAVNYKDAAMWGTFDRAIANCDRSDIHGVGFALSAGDAYIAIDLDDFKRDAATVERSKAIIKIFNSYTELSPSGNGCHIFIKADKTALQSALQGKGYRKNVEYGVEIIAWDRYCTMTGLCGRTGCKPIAYRQVELEQFIAEYFPLQSGKTIAVNAFDSIPVALDQMPEDDAKVWRKMFASNNGDKCFQQYKGEWVHPSENLSERDWSFIMNLRYWTNCNAKQMLRMALQSGLRRAKWFEMRGDVTWLEMEIDKAVAIKKAA